MADHPYNAQILVFIFLGMAMELAVAIALNELRSRRMSRVYQTVIILPYLSFVVIGYIVYALLGPIYGFANRALLPAIGAAPIPWYEKPSYWVYILPAVNFWVYSGMGSVIYLASRRNRRHALRGGHDRRGEQRQQITRITLPLLVPVMTSSPCWDRDIFSPTSGSSTRCRSQIRRCCRRRT